MNYNCFNMKLLFGLGNPGTEYEKNRHNVGFLFVDYLLSLHDHPPLSYDKYLLSETTQLTIGTEKVIVAKPQTFMNKSGEALTKIAIRYSILPSDVIVVHDDLDLTLGNFKIQLGKGPKMHNGIGSIEAHYKTLEFWRIRIGVDARQGKPISGEEYVLQNFSADEQKSLFDIFELLIKHPSFPL